MVLVKLAEAKRFCEVGCSAMDGREVKSLMWPALQPARLLTAMTREANDCHTFAIVANAAFHQRAR
jgi:hypothetical protein